MEPSDHVKTASRKSKLGKRGRRLDPEIDEFDDLAAAETLILLANCNADGFCPRSHTTAATPRRRECIDIASLPTPQSLIVPPAAVNVEKQESVSPDTPLNNGRHGCLVCGRRFQSYQALGGHMTSHRLIKPPTTAPSAVRIHECSDCHEKFPTGQALGGHKRKHNEQLNARKVPATSPSISVHIVSDDCAAAATKLKIDLNMPPPEESDS